MTIHEKVLKYLLRGDKLTSTTLNQIDQNKKTILHRAAIDSCLEAVPEKFLTVKALSMLDDAGRSVFHYAASGHTLKYIDPELFTENALDKKNYCDATVWHVAALNDEIKNIPTRLISEKLLDENLTPADREYVRMFVTLPGDEGFGEPLVPMGTI